VTFEQRTESLVIEEEDAVEKIYEDFLNESNTIEFQNVKAIENDNWIQQF